MAFQTVPRRPCEHGTWTFAGADRKRDATKWRCPTGDRIRLGQGRPAASTDPERDDALEGALSPPGVRRARVRQAQERMGLAPLRVRRLERVQLHADLTILAQWRGYWVCRAAKYL
jgi:hypothetical protein